ncbi:MAG: hypothetical protein KDB22_24105 [Planctomycetales bacterium]|nr:hypothetical protein [Planctomycetales bacterium]
MVESSYTEVHPAFADVLRSQRDAFNQRFAIRQRSGARIDESSFQAHLRTTVNDLVGSVAAILPERISAVVSALFDVSLDLFAAGLLGATTKHPHVASAWREVLPQATQLLARDPLRVAGCLSNAVDYIAAQPDSRPEDWVATMKEVSPLCDSVTQWLDAGKVAAWRSGLVQYRRAALRLARQLPQHLSSRCVGVRSELLESDWPKLLDRMEVDRWFAPTEDGWETPKAQNSHQSASETLMIVRRVGAFRGFGGPCVRPPKVAQQDSALFVSDGEARWQLLADAFGTLWHRVVFQPGSASSKSKVTVDANGLVTWGDVQQTFSELQDASSCACDGQTLAVTLNTSHFVYLVARLVN